MPASKPMYGVCPRLMASALAGVVASACAGNSLGAGYGYQSPPPAGFLTSGPPAMVAAGSLEEDSTRAPIALRAAAVLRDQQWPVIVVDSAADVLLSDWQYFAPAVPSRAASSLCEGGIGLRLSLRPAGKGQRVRLTEEVAYSPRADQQRALSYARLIFRGLYEAIKAAPEPNGSPREESEGWIELSNNLSAGDFRMCGAASS